MIININGSGFFSIWWVHFLPYSFPINRRTYYGLHVRHLGLLRCMFLFGMISGGVERSILSPILTKWKVYFGNGGFAYFPFDPHAFLFLLHPATFLPGLATDSAFLFFHGLHPTRIFSFPPNLSGFNLDIKHPAEMSTCR